MDSEQGQRAFKQDFQLYDETALNRVSNVWNNSYFRSQKPIHTNITFCLIKFVDQVIFVLDRTKQSHTEDINTIEQQISVSAGPDIC